MRTGAIPEVPVLASGLGRAIYEIYGKFLDYLRAGGACVGSGYTDPRGVGAEGHGLVPGHQASLQD
jgi:hypothetical protein